MKTPSKNNLLKQMDIDVWHLRETDQQDCFCYALTSISEKTVGLLFADVAKNIPHEEQNNLLHKIASALTDKIKLTACEFSNELQFVILLGKTAQKKFASSGCVIKNVIASYSLVDLIQNNDYKKELWGLIKPLKEFFI